MAGSYKTNRYNIPQFPYGAVVITPSATDLSTTYPDGVVVLTSTAGDVVVSPLDGGDDIALGAVPAYFTLPFRVKAVKVGTTATIIGIL